MLICHGTADPTVKFQWGRMSSEKLKGWGYDVEFKPYPGLAHSANEDELDDLEAFLKKTLPPIGDAKV